MFSADRSVVITYNGEIYNDDDLASKLARETGFSRRTTCDAEIIPAAYLAWGEDAFSRFEGMFAIALSDREKRKLLLARDEIGIKPLHFYSDDRFVCFASEIKALLANPMMPRRLSAPDVAHMLGSGYTAPNRTLLEDVRQVDPGSVVSIDRSGVRQRRYWQPARRGEIKDLGLASERLVSTLREVVEDQLVSDVPVGVLQSGGIELVSHQSKSSSRARGSPVLGAGSASVPTTNPDWSTRSQICPGAKSPGLTCRRAETPNRPFVRSCERWTVNSRIPARWLRSSWQRSRAST